MPIVATLFSFSLSLSFHLLSFVHPNVDGQHKHLFPPAAVKWLLAFLPVRVINFACFGTDKLLSFIMWRTVHWYISPNWVIKEELCHQHTLMSFIVIEWTWGQTLKSNSAKVKKKVTADYKQFMPSDPMVHFSFWSSLTPGSQLVGHRVCSDSRQKRQNNAKLQLKKYEYNI